jgi:hypothetical protein
MQTKNSACGVWVNLNTPVTVERAPKSSGTYVGLNAKATAQNSAPKNAKSGGVNTPLAKPERRNPQTKVR